MRRIKNNKSVALATQKTKGDNEDYVPPHTPPDYFLSRPPADLRIEMCSDVGIDTLIIWVPLVPGAVRSDNHLRPAYPGDKGFKRWGFLCVDDQGEAVYGWGLVHDDPLMYVKIVPNRPFFNGDTLSGGCTIRISVSKISGHGDNTNPASPEDTRQTFASLEKRLLAIGLRVAILEGKICRIDLFRMIVADPELIDFLVAVVSRIHLTRKQSREYAHGAQRTNKSESLSIYDKGVEVSYRLGLPERLLRGPLRFEWQLKTRAKVLRATALSTVADLLDGMERLPRLYAGYMAGQVFPWQVNTQGGDEDSREMVDDRLKKLWKAMKRRSLATGWTRRELDDCFWGKGWSNLWARLKTTASIESDWASMRRQLNKLRNALMHDALLDPDFAMRYMELKTALTTLSPTGHVQDPVQSPVHAS